MEKIRINCLCGCEFSIPAERLSKIKDVSCPICKCQLPNEYLQKAVECLHEIEKCNELAKNCSSVPVKNSPDGKSMDLRTQFKIDFQP